MLIMWIEEPDFNNSKHFREEEIGISLKKMLSLITNQVNAN